MKVAIYNRIWKRIDRPHISPQGYVIIIGEKRSPTQRRTGKNLSFPNRILKIEDKNEKLSDCIFIGVLRIVNSRLSIGKKMKREIARIGTKIIGTPTSIPEK